MDFKDEIRQFASRVDRLLPQIKTEEATKTSLIMPFLKILGYDVFDPFEVQPEFIADIGIKKGEKVDYAILREGKPIILIECKHYADGLDPHNSQLFRYFHTSEAKFSLLTNGVEYRFYTDLVTPNKMDEKPFFEFKISDIKDNELAELRKFHKSVFDLDSISSAASELKYFNELTILANGEMQNPSDEFVRYFTRQVYPSVVTVKILEQFTPLVKRVFSQIVNDQIAERLKSALKKETENEAQQILTPAEPESLIVTTEEEIDGFLIVKSILRKDVEVGRIFMRDNQSYCGVLLDDNNRKPICRFYFTPNKLRIGLFDQEKKETKYDLAQLDDIYTYSEQIMETIAHYQQIDHKN
ncbi:type I restriction enzyme HsdR N-terminal domain-containing protein [Sphingobacterium sp. SRCM116780]|uniref:type I restriction endonuclease n=1 Tax=Sphingobacterium sp. SRCM116780 TaxID=2907623 RepID=UPI001EEA4400|nr:type I restriction endonuclease [Sphingobacterium sp. SRCM116780]UIR54848.1 type I restriction enzyme HsdR N-terminal domain-containing protein [Sphingobacterium sp. SRCM116780]